MSGVIATVILIRDLTSDIVCSSLYNFADVVELADARDSKSRDGNIVWVRPKHTNVVTVTVSNPLAMERSNEMVEVAMSDIANQLKLADTAQIVVLNAPLPKDCLPLR